MNRVLTILTTFSALLAAAPFLRPRSRAGIVLLWLPKLLGGALSPVAGLIGAIGALTGLARRDWGLAGTGLLGAGLAARFVADLPDVDRELTGLPGPDAQSAGSSTQAPCNCHDLLAGAQRRLVQSDFERDLVLGHEPVSGRALRADLWPPTNGRPSGLGLIYAHGSGWRVGDKDKGTRPFFRRLAAQGHLVLDVAYSLWPKAGLPAMVAELNQAILWLKENGPGYGVNPNRIVLMGASAGGHLALLAAYTPGHPAFQPAGAADARYDTAVNGVVAFYPPVDLLTWENEPGDHPPAAPGRLDRLAMAALNHLFEVQDEDGLEKQSGNFVAEMLGGTPAEVPDVYRLLSPITHVGAHCPPTLLLQGSDDVFELAPAVRRLYGCLLAAGVPAALLEFPHTEHGFDLLLPQVSPVARAAARGVDRFLAGLV